MTHPTPQSSPTGIASIGLAFPSLALPLGELARLRGVDPAKYTLGLGCDEMALCPTDVGGRGTRGDRRPPRPRPLGWRSQPNRSQSPSARNPPST